MPKATPLQPNFNAGEVSPLVYGRVDAERYKSGCATVLNYIPTLQGPLIRRPGTKYITNAKDSSNPPVFIPFQFSQVQAYVLEFGQNYIRFYQNNGQIVNPGTIYGPQGTRNLGYTNFYALRLTSITPQYSGEVVTAYSTPVLNAPLELASPYAVADVAQIRWAQNADTLYLTHPLYPVYKLQRLGLYQWELAQVNFADGPYLKLNSYATTGDSTNIKLNPSSTLSGTLTTGPQDTITNCTNNGSGLIRVTTSAVHGRSTGDKVYIQSVVGTTEANSGSAFAAWTITVISTTTYDLIGSAFVHAYTSGGLAFPALFTSAGVDTFRSIRLLATDGNWYWGNITTATNSASAGFVLTGALPNTTTLPFWMLGEWTTTISGPNYPAAVCFHQNRLCFAGAPNQPQEVNFSNTNLFETFSPTTAAAAVTDSNAMQFTLSSNDINTIRWLKSEAQGLLAGTQSSEWLLQASASNQAMTPTNFNAAQTSYFGSANIDAVQAGNATLHIQRAQRKLRELNYFFQVGTFRSTDLSELSEHLTLPSITKLVVQKESQPIVWALRSDGNFLSMVYNRDDLTLKAGWARHQLGGRSDVNGTNPVVLSATVIPAPDGSFDQLWLVVKRWLNGAQVVTIEYLTKPYDDGFAQADAYHFDCGITYDAYKGMYNFGFQSLTGTTKIWSFGHGFSAGDVIKFSDVVGGTTQSTDIDGNVTSTNQFNGNTFLVAAPVTTNNFFITDIYGNPIDSSTYTAYVSGGKIRKQVTTISGLTWLENETVSVLTDGGIHPNVVVSNGGSITLNYPAGKVQIGLQYNSDGQNLRLEAGAADGTSIGKTRRPTRAAFMLRYVGDFAFGTSFTALRPFDVTRADQQLADQSTGLFSGIHRDGVEAAYDFEGQICWRQNSGLPGMVQALAVFMEEFDV